jgi:preprotein translocase subunit SecG
MGFLVGTFIVLFIINCIFMIFLVLIQTGKNSSLGLMGGASQSVFGSSSVDVLTKITRWTAISFITIALFLSFVFARKEEKLPVLQEESMLQPKEDPSVPSKSAEGTKPPEVPAKQEVPK